MKLTSRIVISCLALVMVVGCTGRDGSFDIRKPYSLDLTPPEGPYEYQEGWSDGCESGSHTLTHNFYKLLKLFEYKMNPELRDNPMYYQAWKDAYIYCIMYWEAVNNVKL